MIAFDRKRKAFQHGIFEQQIVPDPNRLILLFANPSLNVRNL